MPLPSPGGVAERLPDGETAVGGHLLAPDDEATTETDREELFNVQSQFHLQSREGAFLRPQIVGEEEGAYLRSERERERERKRRGRESKLTFRANLFKTAASRIPLMSSTAKPTYGPTHTKSSHDHHTSSHMTKPRGSRDLYIRTKRLVRRMGMRMMKTIHSM